MPAAFAQTTRALNQDRGGPAMAVMALAAATLAAWVAWFCWARVTVVAVSTQARLEVQQAAHTVNAPLAGTLVRQAPPLGTVLQAGDLLLELDAGSPQLLLQEAQARRAGLLAQASALSQEIAARTQAAQSDADGATAAADAARHRADEAAAAARHASERAERLRRDAEAGSVARAEAAQAASEAQRLQATAAAGAADARRLLAEVPARAAQQRAAADNLQRTRAGLLAEAATAEATLQRLALDIAHHRIRAPVAGRVAEVAPLRPGEYVAAGQKLLTLVPTGELIAVADFEPAAVLGRVRPGQQAQLRLQGFPWAQYGTVAATVSRVAGEIRDGRIRVEFTPQGGWPAGVQVQHGLPGTMEVTLESVAPAVLVMRAAGQALGAADAPAALAANANSSTAALPSAHRR